MIFTTRRASTYELLGRPSPASWLPEPCANRAGVSIAFKGGFLALVPKLTTTDKHSLGAYRADRPARRRAAWSVQEIGVNHHIRAVRPAGSTRLRGSGGSFDRFVRDFESGYTPDEIAHARSYLGNLNWDHMMADIAAAQADLKGVGPLGVIGFCMGGTAAFLAACRLPGLSAAVAYYGGMIGKFADEKPKCPLQMNFGEKDEGIPMATVDDQAGGAAADPRHQAPRTAFMRARATTKPPPIWPGAGRRSFWRKI